MAYGLLYCSLPTLKYKTEGVISSLYTESWQVKTNFVKNSLSVREFTRKTSYYLLSQLLNMNNSDCIVSIRYNFICNNLS